MFFRIRDGHIDEIERRPVFNERRNMLEDHGLHVQYLGSVLTIGEEP
jgi:hypothetical protein